ncbi:unnamed protein product [Strongylus vulgaris]|uniref:Uncharacterized protein n=1 Tax=Strongylus vulgaris TaxID=40348 RepID=A0A3P7JPP8_STRVU|nr:unnamed protein product [Strongylus vulgaris]
MSMKFNTIFRFIPLLHLHCHQQQQLEFMLLQTGYMYPILLQIALESKCIVHR